MIEYKIVIEDNDYLWNSERGQLVKYNSASSTVVIGSISPDTSVNVAFPIQLNEDVLEAIGFNANGNAKYSNGNYVINIDGKNPESILQIDGNPIRYVSDLQNFCRLKGEELNIDEEKLSEACTKTISAQKS